MVHKSANSVFKTELSSGNNGSGNMGIHKTDSTHSWLDEYDNAVDKMNRQLDREYDESAKRQEEAEERIAQLQEEEEYERLMEEERLHQEEMRQLEVEKARLETVAIKEYISKMRQPPQPYPAQKIEEVKPTLKQKLTKVAKTIGSIAGAVTGHPEVSAIAGAVPVPEGKKVEKTVYEEPREEVEYGTWKKV